MVCKKCEKNLKGTITPDVWKDGAKNTTESKEMGVCEGIHFLCVTNELRGILPMCSLKLYTVKRPLQPSNPIQIYFRYHILVILVWRIFFCSWKIPYISASLVGGHPGT